MNAIKELKYNHLISSPVTEIKGAIHFLEKCLLNNVTIVIVTNTSKKVVSYFKEKVPVLNKIKNWICKEDYILPKPHEECYKLAIEKFYCGQKYIIGFENTINGYNALKNVVHCSYFITDKSKLNYNVMIKKDSYLIKDFTHFL
jgi:beta-phosphoglucomutase-like phosphatase (HAD superfamily)